MSRAARAAERLAGWLWPRRCPLCGALLGPDAADRLLCPRCAPAAAALAQTPPRLPEGAYAFYALGGAAAAFRYEGPVRRAILRCKGRGDPWYARELAALIAVRVYGAAPAPRPGGRPQPEPIAGLPAYHLVVPVPPRGRGGSRLPVRLARRLGRVLGVPAASPLRTTRPMRPQKTLDRAARLENTRGAYACRPGTDLSGMRVLLVDDVITTGATVSACALALLQAGAVSVFAVSVAADPPPSPQPRPAPPAQEKLP